MAVAAAFVMLLGVCMVLVTGIFALISVGDLRMSRRLRRVVPSPLGSWRRGVVSAEAVTEFGAGGRQVGPLSGEECTWYEMTIERVNNTENRSDLYLDAGRSPQWPSIADSTGRVALDPRLLVDGQGQVRTYFGPSATEQSTEEWERRRGSTPPAWISSKLERSMSYGDRVLLREVRLSRGRKVFAMGRVSDGALRAGRRAFVTPERWADLISARESDLRLMTKTIPVFFIGGIVVAAAGLGFLLLVTR